MSDEFERPIIVKTSEITPAARFRPRSLRGSRREAVGGFAMPDQSPSSATSGVVVAPSVEEAFYGLAGDIVRTIEPHSEADPLGILVQLLVMFGNVVGRGPYFQVE